MGGTNQSKLRWVAPIANPINPNPHGTHKLWDYHLRKERSIPS